MFYKTFTFTKHLLSQNFLKHTFYSSKKYILSFYKFTFYPKVVMLINLLIYCKCYCAIFIIYM